MATSPAASNWDDSAIRIADNQLTHEVPQKRKVPDNHQLVIRGGQ
jgi:hypothetical protein